MRVLDLGEFGLIELLNNIISKSKNPRDTSWQQLLVGIGDDAAAWQGNNVVQLATMDTLVEGVHFNFNTTCWEELGWKALAVNLSDIAAMGGTPRYALVSLALPTGLKVEDISNLYKGMAQIANEFSVAIVGGDVVAAPNTVITIAVFGSLEDKRKSALTRSAARVGDQIAVTGYLGLSAAGLKMLSKKLDYDDETTSLLRKAHLQPMPRINEGQVLLQQGVRSAIDISDGLIADLAQICKASQIGAIVRSHQIPIHPLVQARFKADCMQLALTGGEDYELVFTASEETINQVKQTLACPVTVIGEITKERPGQVTLIDATGNTIPWQQGGWEHFKSQAFGTEE